MCRRTGTSTCRSSTRALRRGRLYLGGAGLVPPPQGGMEWQGRPSGSPLRLPWPPCSVGVRFGGFPAARRLASPDERAACFEACFYVGTPIPHTPCCGGLPGFAGRTAGLLPDPLDCGGLLSPTPPVAGGRRPPASTPRKARPRPVPGSGSREPRKLNYQPLPGPHGHSEAVPRGGREFLPAGPTQVPAAAGPAPALQTRAARRQ
jgi:hypothetical protein